MWLPLFNTALILVSGAFLGTGYFFIRRRRIVAHHRSMIIAAVFAALFLVVYVIRWVGFGAKPFEGPEPAYALYLGILIPHVIAAIALAPMAAVTLAFALRSRFFSHRRIARITLPVWAFVAITGWVVYTMLYVIQWG